MDKDIDKDILILTDSRSSVEAIINNRMAAHTPKAILNIKEVIANIQERRKEGHAQVRKIVIGWIPSHVGIEGNEMADTVAKAATEQEHDSRIKVPYSD